MTPEQTAKVGLPIVPRSKVDPTRSAKQVTAMYRDIEERYLGIKRALKALFDQRLTGREREVNSHSWHFLCHDHGEDMRLYQVNAGKFIYDMSAQELADLLEAVQVILDDYLLEGGEQNLWAMDYIAAEAQRGTLEAFNNLSQQSQVYASQTTLQQLLSSPGYLNQIAAATLTTFSDWKVISDTARGDLTNIITDAVARGVNPRETASVISKRLDVSMSKAKTIAQTEQVGALRQAQWKRNGLGGGSARAEYWLAVAICAQTDDAQLARQPSRQGLHHRAGARLLRRERQPLELLLFANTMFADR
ncbi:phage head morphogenesis protein, SPP1 gp7 family [Klebsiella pneumoniae]|uniref:Phage head morphogenesis protein, SPP1 gp7 family n=1 Tax=Klebsiella pneumoniae TaxID=573 RepID=A0A378FV44_KLEPN|nr:phage head morphogenesis protein, SPP1 gp7 family [Klebsiella pneumoniae]